MRRKFEPRPATPQQIATIADNMPDKYRALILLAAWCGLRWGEVSELRRQDVDLASMTVRVAGRPDLRVHDLRHSAATMAAQAGATLAELMARMGDSTTKAALVYQHVAEGRDRIIAERMALLAEPLLAQPTFPDGDVGRWRP